MACNWKHKILTYIDIQIEEIMKKVLVLGLLIGALGLSGCSFDDGSAKEQGNKNTQSKQTEVLSQNVSEIAETQTEEAEEIVEPEINTITVTATGDCTLGKMQDHGYSGSFNAYYDSYGEDYFFDGVRDVFESDDFTIVNLECVLSNSEARVDKTYNLKGKPEYVGIMSGSSVEACSLGNNHSRDYGEQSLKDTQNVLDEAGIVYAYNDHIGTYTTDEGMTIGVVSASLLSMSADYENYLYNGIQRLKEQGTDLIIASCHWGIEREYYPNDYQKRVAHELIDKGADLVIGHHPHVLQGVELYNGKIICYSLGNFCFGGNRNPSDKDTMMFQQTFTYVDGVLQTDVNAKIIPCMLSSTSSYNDFKPTITTDDRKGLIIDNVNTYSEPYSNIRFSDSGMLTIKE